MKIVNLHDYSEGDEMKDKLRQRIDGFEPELSDSLWDRIHHEMDQRESNRKKRFLWWFSSVAVVVLASGIISFMLVNQTGQPIVVQQIPTTQTPTANGGAASVQAPSATNNEAGINTTATTAAPIIANEAVSSTPHYNSSNSHRNTRNNSGVVVPAAGNGNVLSNSDVELTPESLPVEIPASNATVPATNNDINPVEVEEDVELQDVPVAATDKLEETVENINKPVTEKSKITNTIPRKKWFVGAMFGYNQTYRSVENVSNQFGMPTAEQKNTYEVKTKAYSPTYGIEFGYLPIKNLFIKTGISVFNSSETVKYSIYRRKDLSGIVGGPGNPKDSVGQGNNITTKNTYSYIQIPVEIGFTTNFYKNFGVFVSGGLAYNVLNSYNYNYYESYWGRQVNTVNNSNSKYFSNYLQVGGSVGAQYAITNNWRASLGFTYRKAVTSASTKETGVSVKPWSAGGNVSLAYTF